MMLSAIGIFSVWLVSAASIANAAARSTTRPCFIICNRFDGLGSAFFPQDVLEHFVDADRRHDEPTRLLDRFGKEVRVLLVREILNPP
jgi:hypothetical protein